MSFSHCLLSVGEYILQVHSHCINRTSSFSFFLQDQCLFICLSICCLQVVILPSCYHPYSLSRCFYNCVHGHCSGPLDYVCICRLGWTNPWCNESCNCNNHSTCSKGVGICDECQHRTTGENCELCSSGSYGNPQDLEGWCAVCCLCAC